MRKCKKNYRCNLVEAREIIRFILENVHSDAKLFTEIFISNFEKQKIHRALLTK